MSILKLTSDALSSPAVAGQIEYDGKTLTVTPQSTERGIIPGAQFYRLNANLAGANVNTAQNVLGVGVTLSGSTVYEFEAVYVLSKSAGTTSHSIGLGFGGTATVNNFVVTSAGGFDNSATSPNFSAAAVAHSSRSTSNATASNATTAAATTFYIQLRGTISVNAGGTLIPQYTLSAAPGGAYTTQAGSYFLIYPIGAAGSATNVGTWA